MKMKYLVFGSFAFYSYFANAQNPDSNTTPVKINKTEIEVLYSQYLQDGNHSAVTGGLGTEKLNVYATRVFLKKTAGKNTYSIRGGIDVISSASTDNIDSIVSSASKLDARTYVNLDYSRLLKKEKWAVSGGAGFSIESDYFSRMIRIGAEYSPSNKMRTYFLNIQMYFDDLRWGRLNWEYRKPVKLIYPSELRDREWFDIHRRNTYAFNSGFTQVVNKKNVAGIFFEIIFQDGLLSTPFHRVYFTDSSHVVENLPKNRLKGILGLHWNAFVGGRLVLRNRINTYLDDFGIKALNVESESVIKVLPQFSFGPHFRFYLQEGSRFFAPHRGHHPFENFYTSDFDLSTLRTFLIGFSGRYTPNVYMGKRFSFNNLNLRYSYFKRSDQLHAHIVSIFFNTSFNKTEKSTGNKE